MMLRCGRRVPLPPACLSRPLPQRASRSVPRTRRKAKGMRPERKVRKAKVTRSQVTLNGRLVARMASNRVMKRKLESPLRVPPLQARS